MGPKGKPAGLTRTHQEQKATKHFGFEVVGVSLESVDCAANFARLKKEVFDRDSFIKKANPKRAIKRVFQLQEAAALAKEILAKQGGFVNLQVLPIYKA